MRERLSSAKSTQGIFYDSYGEQVAYFLNQIKGGAGEKGAMHRAAEIARS
jgi:hypothetical protein